MEKLQVGLICMLFFYLPIKLNGATQLPNPCIICEDSTAVRVLVLQHRRKNKKTIFTSGTPIRYWLRGEEGKKRGIIFGFTEDAIIMSDQLIKLEAIQKIKKADDSGIVFVKILGILVIIGSAFFGFVFTALAFSGWLWLNSGIAGGLGIIILSSLLIYLGTLAAGINRRRDLDKKYEAKIMDIVVG